MEVRKRGLNQSPFSTKDTLPFPIYILSLLEILIEIQSTHDLTRKVFKGLDSVVKLLTWIGNGAIALITLIFMIDVCGRAFLNKPLYGSNELIELTMIILGFAIVYATWTKQHVKMDILSPRLPRRTQAILTSIGSLLEFGISAVIAYEVFMKAKFPLSSPFRRDQPYLHCQSLSLCLA
jgi:hypothetical protein